MNQITGALKAAGVSLPPLNYRIWHWLRDHQAKSYIEIASALNVDPHTITTAVSSMVKRGMLSYRNESNGKTKGSGPRSVRLYSTVYKEYEVLPVPLKNSPCKTNTKSVPLDAPIVKIDTLPQRPVSKVDIEALTLREARALYTQLKEFFE